MLVLDINVSLEKEQLVIVQNLVAFTQKRSQRNNKVWSENNEPCTKGCGTNL